MKAVILAGGMGTRIAEESHLRPKPMIEIGGRPILWHIMNIYTAHGVTDFIICLGYRGYMIKEYFVNYVMHESDLTVDERNGEIIFHANYAEPWRVTLVDTGLDTMTGGRLKRIRRYLDSDECFCMTYGDGVADVDITALIAFHHRHGIFVLHPDVLERIEGDATPWETAPLESLARDGELCAYRHEGFWQPMDTMRDRTTLETLWASGTAPWKMWKD
jgi:glucose-1-phosphate cytidylyltransferase